ncbi:MAG: DMT family transporter [Thermomicrobiales bacterium]
MNEWLMLANAIAAEIVGTTSLKLSDGFSRLSWTTVVIIGYALSFYLMSQALKTLPIGLVYAIWSGVGTVGTALLGLAIFGETFTALKAAGIALIVGGVIVLNAGGAH